MSYLRSPSALKIFYTCTFLKKPAFCNDYSVCTFTSQAAYTVLMQYYDGIFKSREIS